MSATQLAVQPQSAEDAVLEDLFPLGSPPSSSMASSAHHTCTALFREHFAGVRSAVQRFGVPPRNAEDVAQEVFVAVFKAIDRYDPARPFKPWLRTIAYRTARDSLELSYTRERLVQTGRVDSVESSENPEQRVLAKQAQNTLSEVLQNLEPDNRTVFLMAELDQITQPEIAQALGVPEPTVQSRLRRARDDFDKAAYRRRLTEENRLRNARAEFARRSRGPSCLGSSGRSE